MSSNRILVLLLAAVELVACARPPSIIDVPPEQLRARVALPLPPLSPGLCKATQRQLAMPDPEHPSAICGNLVEGLEPAITSIGFDDVPGGGLAYRTVYRQGHVKGGHMSGSPESPTVTEEGGCVSADCVRALWRLAAEVMAEVKLKLVVSQPQGESYRQLELCDDDSCTRIIWTGEAQTLSSRVEALTSLMSAMEIGYW